jgi:hypothetical protein
MKKEQRRTKKEKKRDPDHISKQTPPLSTIAITTAK